MNPAIKAFIFPTKTVFHSFCKLTSGICDGICHHACPCNSVVIWQLLTDEEKGPCYGRAVLGRQTTAAGSQPAHLHMLAESSISSSHRSAPLHKPRRGMLCQPPAWRLAAGWPCPLGNLFCEARGNVETQKQESRSPTRMCLLLPMECSCLPHDPTLSVWGRLAAAGTQRWVQESPANGPGNGSSGGSCIPSPARCCAT